MFDNKYSGYGDPMFLNELRKMSQNLEYAILTQNDLLGRSHFGDSRYGLDDRRNIDDEAGYPNWDSVIEPELLQRFYDREGIATRTVEMLPKETWKIQPKVYETEDNEVNTAWEKAWDELGSMINPDSLRGDGRSFHKQEQGSHIWEKLERLDTQCGVGSYGVLLFGLDDGSELYKPAEYRQGQRINYLRVFTESVARISSLDNDKSSRRFGRPTNYHINYTDSNNYGAFEGIGSSFLSQGVHWSRVLHVADNKRTSETFGVSRLTSSFNRQYDLRKIYGSDGEMVYKGAFPGFSIETHPNMGGNVKLPKTQIREMVEQYQNTLQRYLAFSGATVKSLAPQVTDLISHVELQLDAICIQNGWPKRKFMGSERGELASTEDENDWNDVLMGRRHGFVTPMIIRPFIDRCIDLGVLPEPETGQYFVDWPKPDTQTEGEKADIAVKFTQALVQYANSNASSIMTPLDYLVEVWNMDHEKAKKYLEEAEKILQEEEIEEEKIRQLMEKEGFTQEPNPVPTGRK